MGCNPRKWLHWIPLAGLPFLAAVWLNGKAIESQLSDAARASLVSAKAEWAELSFDGRDAHLAGNAPGRVIIEQAVQAIAATSGVRRVDASAAKVLLASPTVNSLLTNKDRPEITGTWPESFAKTLSVTLPGRTYVLGKDEELKSDGAGNWRLVPSDPLEDGVIEVAVDIDDGAGATAKTAEPGKIAVDTLPPAQPAFTPVRSSTSPPSLSGTWAEGDAVTLRVEIAGETHVLGSDPRLASLSGKWTLALPKPLPEGVFDLFVETTDRVGNGAQLRVPAALTIAPIAPAPRVAKYSGNDATPVIAGSWSEGQGNALSVAIGGRSHELGKDPNLSSNGTGNWKLALAEPLKDGIYDAVATVTDALGDMVKDQTVGEIEIDTTGPTAPTVNSATTLPVSGIFAPLDTKILRVTVAGQSYTLGVDAALTAKEDVWSLMTPTELAAGTYDVVVETVDGFGNVSADASKDELVVGGNALPAAQPPSAKIPPTVAAQESTMARPVITGTWAEGSATSLKVSIAGNSFILGSGDELTSASGQWSLRLPAPLKDGTYDVAVETADPSGSVATDSSANELVIDAAGPSSPTIALYSSSQSPAVVTGTWPEGDAISLAVTFIGKTAMLGKDKALASDGKGNWSLAVDGQLAPGSYDVAAIVVDKNGRSSADQTRFEVLVKEVSATSNPPPNKCEDDLARILTERPIIFERDRSAVSVDAASIIKDLAAIAITCPAEKLEVGGYTDNVGSESYNQALSERRAVAVAHALAEFGIERARLSAVGYGESAPVAGNDTQAGRSLNRRIEIKVLR